MSQTIYIPVYVYVYFVRLRLLKRFIQSLWMLIYFQQQSNYPLFFVISTSCYCMLHATCTNAYLEKTFVYLGF